MTNHKQEDSEPTFDRLMEALADSVLDESDEEILEEVREAGEDPAVAAEAVRGAMLAALAEAERQVFGKVPDRDPMSGTEAPEGLASLPLSEKRRIVERYLAGHGGAAPTAAARNGQPMTESELDSFLDDLRELGAIDEKGDPA